MLVEKCPKGRFDLLYQIDYILSRTCIQAKYMILKLIQKIVCSTRSFLLAYRNIFKVRINVQYNVRKRKTQLKLRLVGACTSLKWYKKHISTLRTILSTYS